MKVKKAMHKGVQWVGPGTPVQQLARLMREHDIGAIPIGENDRLIGMVTDRDIVCRCIAAGLDPKTATARDVMTEGIIFCLDNQELDDAARDHGNEEGPPPAGDQRQEAHDWHTEPRRRLPCRARGQ